jgi:hypothetical protein
MKMRIAIIAVCASTLVLTAAAHAGEPIPGVDSELEQGIKKPKADSGANKGRRNGPGTAKTKANTDIGDFESRSVKKNTVKKNSRTDGCGSDCEGVIRR